MMQKLKYIAFLLIALSIMYLLYYLGAFGSHFSLARTTFKSLPEWESDNQSEAFFTFKQSCKEILKRKPNANFSALPKAGLVKNWQTICLAANKIKTTNPQEAKIFFETWFIPYVVRNHWNPHGLFTGYYLPDVPASLTENKEYSVPIYGFPRHFVSPIPTRAEINKGALKNHASVIAWSNNKVDLFFAQVQGSAMLVFPDHSSVLIGYAGDNNYSYTPIGKILVQQDQVKRKDISMQTIRDWLLKHPEQVDTLLNHDASYVFFKILKNNNPIGIEQIPLTPNRSLAVDTRYIPLGAPVWLETQLPDSDHSVFKHLLIAQDTGGAIKGAVRGDIYFGAGEQATFLAGHMNQSGRYWILLPK